MVRPLSQSKPSSSKIKLNHNAFQTPAEDLGHTDGSHSTHDSNYNAQSRHSSNHHRTSSSNLDGQYELLDRDMKPAASSHNQQWTPDNVSTNLINIKQFPVIHTFLSNYHHRQALRKK